MLTVVGRFKRAVMKQNSSEHCRSKTHKMDIGATVPTASVPSTSHQPRATPQLCKNGRKQVEATESSLAKGRTGDHPVGKRLQQSQAYLSLRPHQRTRQKANFRDDFGPPLSSSSSFSSSNEPFYPCPSPNKFPKTNPFFKGSINYGQQGRGGYAKLNCVPRGQPATATVCPIVEESESTTTDSALTSSHANSGSSESQESLSSGGQRAHMKKIIAGLKTFGIKVRQLMDAIRSNSLCALRGPRIVQIKQLLCHRCNPCGHQGELYSSMILNRGMLTISIDEARNLQPPPGSTSCNAYIRLSLMPDEEKRTQYKSEVVPGSNAPVFNLNVSFEVLPEDARKRVFVSVWNRDAKTQKGALLGCMAFSIRGLVETKQVEGWYYLLAPSYGRHKHLAVEKVNMLTYYGSVDSLQRRQLLRRPISGPAFL